MKNYILLILFGFGIMNSNLAVTKTPHIFSNEVLKNEINADLINAVETEKLGVFKKIKRFIYNSVSYLVSEFFLAFGIIVTITGAVIFVIGLRRFELFDDEAEKWLRLVIIGGMVASVGATMLLFGVFGLLKNG